MAPAQRLAAHNKDQLRRRQRQNVRKSSEDLAAEARRYAPGGHRACLLAAAHFREQEEMAEGKVPAPSAPESAAARAERYEPGAHRGLPLMAAHREEQHQQQAAPAPSAITGEACPWTRLVSKMKVEGCTPENKAEHERLKALDAAEATAKARAAAATSTPSPLQQRWEAIKARAQATPAYATAAVPAVHGVASPPKSEVADWLRAALRRQRAAGASF